MKFEIDDKYFNEEELKNTPERWKRFLDEWLNKSKDFEFRVFDNPGYDEIISVTHIPFYSMCAHHLLPFIGTAHVGYVPNDKICGISKLARVVDMFAHRPQLQERLTMQIRDYVNEKLNPKGVMVVLEAEHLCMSMRGIKKPGHRTKTSALCGVFENKDTRNEFLTLIRNSDD